MSYIKQIAIVAGLLLSIGASAQTYRAANLGNLGGHWSNPAALNDKGHVAGTSDLPSRFGHAFLWNNMTGMLDLDPNANDLSGATAINDADDVTGWGGTSGNVVLWTPESGWQNLGTLPGRLGGIGLGINDHFVVGVAFGNGGEQAFIWDETDGMQPLSQGNGRFNNTVATAINKRGYAVGYGSVSGEALTQHALMWSPFGGVADLGTLGGLVSSATAINSSNMVVGTSLTSDGATHPFLWTRAGGMQDLGLLSGYFSCSANGINREEQVVGECFPPVPTEMPHAFLWTPSGGMQDLNSMVSGSLPVTLGAALAINGRGQITVRAASSPRFNPQRAYLLTPQ